MTWQTFDRVKETTTTTGTGALTLAGAMSGFQSFASTCTVGDTFYYGLQAVDSNGNANGVWEVGVGTYSAASTLTRSSVLASSNAGAAVTLPTGTAQVWIDMPAVALAALASSQYAVDQGGFVNGNLDFWSAGTSFTINGAVDTLTADNWIVNAGTGGQIIAAQSARTLGSESALITRPNPYKIELTQNNTPTTNPTLGQKLAGVGQYNGRTITISATVNTPSSGNNFAGFRVTQHFGSGGSPSADVVTNSAAITWVNRSGEHIISGVINVPSITGKTMGTTAGTDYVRVDMVFSLAGGQTTFVTQLQIDVTNPGAATSPAGLGTDGVPLPFRNKGLVLEGLRDGLPLGTVCAFSAGCSTSQSIPGNTATTVTSFTAVKDDSGGAMNFSTGVFTAPVNGWYQVSGQVAFASATYTSGVRVESVLSINGTATIQSAVSLQASFTGALYGPVVGGPTYLTAGQTLTLQAFQSTSSAIALIGAGAAVFLNVALLSAG